MRYLSSPFPITGVVRCLEPDRRRNLRTPVVVIRARCAPRRGFAGSPLPDLHEEAGRFAPLNACPTRIDEGRATRVVGIDVGGSRNFDPEVPVTAVRAIAVGVLDADPEAARRWPVRGGGGVEDETESVVPGGRGRSQRVDVSGNDSREHSPIGKSQFPGVTVEHHVVRRVKLESFDGGRDDLSGLFVVGGADGELSLSTAYGQVGCISRHEGPCTANVGASPAVIYRSGKTIRNQRRADRVAEGFGALTRHRSLLRWRG